MGMKSANLECVIFLLDEGAQIFINDPIWNEMSPVFYAVRLNDVQIMEALCDSKQGSLLSRMKTGKGYSPI